MTDGIRNQINDGIFLATVIQGRDITVNLPPQVPLALSGLPRASPAFTGRGDELRTLLDSLAPDTGERSRPVVVTAVGGLAGVGKTELAGQAARAALARGWFPGGVLFVDLFGYDPSRRLEPGQALGGFLRALGVPGEHIPSDAQDRARLYTSILAAYERQGRRILVIIDNASATDQVEPLLSGAGGTPVIITSRHTLGMLGARLLDLDVLDRDDAIGILREELQVARRGDTRVIDHPEDAARLAELCGGLPLALKIVAALLAENPSRSPAAMVGDLADAGTRLEEMRYADIAVRTAFDLSYRHLTPDQARLFRLLTVNPGPEISTAATAAMSGLAEAEARLGLEALARANLIEHGSAEARWRMHDLVRLYAEQQGGTNADADGRSDAHAQLVDHYLTTTRAAVGHLDPTVSDPAADGFPDRSRALVWLDTEYPNLNALVYAAAPDSDQAEIVRDLPLTLGNYLIWRRYHADMEALYTRVTEAAYHLGDRKSEGRALTNIGLALYQSRRFDESIPVCRQAIQTCRETGDRRTQARALNNLGWALKELGRYDEAITAHRQDLLIRTDIDDRLGAAIALDGIGKALDGAGQLEDAITVYQEAVQIFREIGELRGEAITISNLGQSLAEVERFEEAVAAQHHAIELDRQLGDRHGQAIAVNALGITFRKMRRFEEAATTSREAAELCRETDDRHVEGEALQNIGLALGAMRRFEEAFAAYRQAAAVFSEIGESDRASQTLRCLEIDRQAQHPVRTALGRLLANRGRSTR